LSAAKFINLNASITTRGTQTYNGSIIVMKNVDLISTNSNITFNNDIYALTGGESFVINAGTGNVTFNGSVG
jgi:hypothetical protein